MTIGWYLCSAETHTNTLAQKVLRLPWFITKCSQCSLAPHSLPGIPSLCAIHQEWVPSHPTLQSGAQWNGQWFEPFESLNSDRNLSTATSCHEGSNYEAVAGKTGTNPNAPPAIFLKRWPLLTRIFHSAQWPGSGPGTRCLHSRQKLTAMHSVCASTTAHGSSMVTNQLLQ